jgi:signal transduction histidine kinase
VTDDGAPATAAPDRAGHGLVGMRERVAAWDGSVTAGPGPAGGWRVAAVLPLVAARAEEDGTPVAAP